MAPTPNTPLQTTSPTSTDADSITDISLATKLGLSIGIPAGVILVLGISICWAHVYYRRKEQSERAARAAGGLDPEFQGTQSIPLQMRSYSSSKVGSLRGREERGPAQLGSSTDEPSKSILKQAPTPPLTRGPIVIAVWSLFAVFRMKRAQNQGPQRPQTPELTPGDKLDSIPEFNLQKTSSPSSLRALAPSSLDVLAISRTTSTKSSSLTSAISRTASTKTSRPISTTTQPQTQTQPTDVTLQLPRVDSAVDVASSTHMSKELETLQSKERPFLSLETEREPISRSVSHQQH